MLGIIYPYYENPTMLEIQLDHWNKLPKKLTKQLQIYLIDDGSEKTPAKEVIGSDQPSFLKQFRVLKNIPWNQHGCRNLGMQVTEQDWNFLTDMDVLIPQDTLETLVEYPLAKGTYYSFERLKAPDLEPYRLHCNTFVIHKADYWKIGGYDEDYCGTYGGDGPFHKFLNNVTKRTHFKDLFIHYYPRGYITDAGTNDFNRKGSFKDLYHKTVKAKKANGKTRPENPVRFPWEEIKLD